MPASRSVTNQSPVETGWLPALTLWGAAAGDAALGDTGVPHPGHTLTLFGISFPQFLQTISLLLISRHSHGRKGRPWS